MGLSLSRERRQPNSNRTLRSWKKRETIPSFYCGGVPSPRASQVEARNRNPHTPLVYMAPLRAELPTELLNSEEEPAKFDESPTPINPTRDSRSCIVQFRLDHNSEPPAVSYDRKPSLTTSSDVSSATTSNASSATQDTQFSLSASPVFTRTTDPPSLPPRPPKSQLATFQLSLASTGNFKTFNWDVGHATKERAAKLYQRLISQSARSTWFTETQIFEAARIKEGDKNNAASAWNRICAGHSSMRCRDISVEFCEYLLHLIEAARQGIGIPCQIPIWIRAQYNRKTTIAYDKFKTIHERGQSFEHTFLRIRDELEQGRIFVAFLELTLESGSIQTTLSSVHELMQAQTRFEGFRLVGVEELSNLLATLIRTFRARNLGRSRRDDPAAFELFGIVVNLADRKTSELFHSIVTKLEGLEVPLCLGFFLNAEECLLYADEERYVFDTKELFRCLEAHYATVYSTSFANSGRFMPFWSVVELLRTDRSSGRPFLVSMHRCMEIVDKGQWKTAWRDFGREEEYKFQLSLIGERLACQNIVTQVVFEGI